MNKDTINIDGKTYVRQDAPSINPTDITNARKKLAKIVKLSLLGSFMFGSLLVMLGFDILISFIVFWFAFCISVIIGNVFVRKEFSDEVFDAAFPARAKLPESSISSSSYEHRYSTTYSNYSGNIHNSN